MKDGNHIVLLRRITLGLVFAAVLASLAFDWGLGTPSSFGIGAFNLLCPLGGLEAMLADQTFIPRAAISMTVVLLFAVFFGRLWCSWGCPAPAIRSFFKRNPKAPEIDEETGNFVGEPATVINGVAYKKKAPVPEASSVDRTDQPVMVSSVNSDQTSPSSAAKTSETNSTAANSSCGGCTSCSGEDSEKTSILSSIVKNTANDKRLWILVGVLLVTFIVGFPIFCLICPIGLTFGSVSSLWHLIVDKQVTLSVIVFPLCLVIELIVYRKWCINLCPIGGLLGVFGHFAKLFRPRVDASTCLRYTSDKECIICLQTCPEHINMHVPEGQALTNLDECTRCGECLKHCPTQSISIEVKPSDPLVIKE